MDRPLIAFGSVAAALLLAYGVSTAAAKDDGAQPAAPVAVPAAPGSQAAPAGAAPTAGTLPFETLTAYEYQQGMVGLPDSIKALDGKTVAMRGFLLPLYEFDDIHEFVLVANHMSCCFGIPSGINGQIYVKIAGGGRGLPNSNEPIEVKGTFHARERVDQGYVLSIYEIVDASARIVGY